MNRIDEDTHIIVLQKKDERYVWLYRDENRAEVLRRFGRFADNKELSLTWYDAAVLASKVRTEWT